MNQGIMKQEDRLKIQAWLDGELAPQESAIIADLVDSNLEAKAVAGELETIQKVLKSGENKVSLGDSRDFYWSQIHRQIEAENPEPLRETAPFAAGSGESPLRWILPISSLAAISILIVNFNTIDVNQSNSKDITDPTVNGSGLTENSGSALEEEFVLTPEVGVFSFEGVWNNRRDLISPEDPNAMPESIENPE